MKYSTEFLTALALWQNGWREDPAQKLQLGTNLLDAASSISGACKTLPGPCYRVVLLNAGTIFSLFSNGKLAETVSSWTTEKTFASRFKNHLGQGQIGFVFKHIPVSTEVIVNIQAMWEDPEFHNCLKSHKQDGIKFHRALEHFSPQGENQHEVVLSVDGLNLSEIVGLSGRSSFEGICQLAGAVTEDEKDKLWQDCLSINHQPDSDVFWLNEEAVWRVLDRVTAKIQEIVEQERSGRNIDG